MYPTDRHGSRRGGGGGGGGQAGKQAPVVLVKALEAMLILSCVSTVIFLGRVWRDRDRQRNKTQVCVFGETETDRETKHRCLERQRQTESNTEIAL